MYTILRCKSKPMAMTVMLIVALQMGMYQWAVRITKLHSISTSMTSVSVVVEYPVAEVPASNMIPLAMSTAINKISVCNKSTPGAIRCWDNKYPFVFMHIGKSGGSSFSSTIYPIVTVYMHGKYIGKKHFNWAGIEEKHRGYIAIMFRHPVYRTISNFYFSQTMDWAKNHPIRRLSLGQYLRTYQVMLDTKQIWGDGESGTYWLTGTNIWVYLGNTKNDMRRLEEVNVNYTYICQLAAKRLEQTWWFGFLDDQERSLELLQYQMGYKHIIQFPHIRNTAGKLNVTKHIYEIIESLVPMDIWFYNYAKLVFEARWNQYKSGVYVIPTVPDLPTPSCMATRFVIKCNKGPLSPLYFRNKSKPPGNKYLL